MFASDNIVCMACQGFFNYDIIIPFSSHSKVSCDTSGNFIEFNFSNWEVNRAYKLEFKMVSDGDEIFYDDDITFSIIEK